MEKQDIMDYVLKTPENTNPAILRGMLDQLEESSSGGGSECIKNAVVSVTSDSETSLKLQSYLVDATTIAPSLSGYIINGTLISIQAGQSKNILVPSNGLCYSLTDESIEVIDGEATVTEVIAEGVTFNVLKINGNCTLKVSSPK